MDAALKGAAKTLEARYEYPFINHSALEPMNTTASFKNGKLTLWSPTQMPGGGKTAVAKLLGIDEKNIQLNVTRSGGGFGRRLSNDFMVEAAAISKEIGEPVKLVWNRRQDLGHGFSARVASITSRPASMHRARWLRSAITSSRSRTAARSPVRRT